jgi:hypothetical protein
MKLRHLFTINLPVSILIGLLCALLPAFTLELYGLPAGEAAIWVSRLTGGSILGFATLMWFGRKTAEVKSRRAIAYALLVQDTIGFIASLEIQLKGTINAFGWSSPILYAALAIGYAYFLFVRPADS